MGKPQKIEIDEDIPKTSSDVEVAKNEAKTKTKTNTAAAAELTGDEQKTLKQSAQNKSKAKKVLKPEASIPRGQPKSNRPWKTPKQKFSQIKKTVNRLTFEKKMELRNEMRYIKEKSKEIKEQRKEAAVQRHQRRVENAERRLANERRAEVVQVIKNPAKLKRMKKKQMRMIEKRDLSQVKVV